ncbi:MAG TPA: protein-disulfide reductase DsbD domain-containing protein [Candidatus Sulfotelmatobacter sp.]|nr:protein-disulfide reductase DsbD domain-containing protein [Candidatus Sulfotelmatobacter sp.]
MVLLKRLLPLFAMLFFAAGPAHAGAKAWAENDQGQVGLISAVTAVGDQGRVQLGLHFKLKEGWKIYWRSPGDAGYPPAIDWKGSDNLNDVVISWPGPHRFSVSGLETMGYKDEVVLPIVALMNDPAQPLAIRAAVDYLVCDVICVPQHVDLALDIPTGAAQPSEHAHLIGRFLAKVPGDPYSRGLKLVQSEATTDGTLKVVFEANPPLSKPDLFVERSDQMQFGPPKTRIEQGGKRVIFHLTPVANTGEGGLTEKPVTLTMVDGDRGTEIVADVAPPQPGLRLGALVSMLGVALLGGFLLNLMPCVLPVLSIKVLSLIGHGGQERQAVRTGFLASAAGIVTSFLLLALVAGSLKLAGMAVGWGVQFQQPLFLACMVVIVTLFAANLLGLFDIPLPQWAASLGSGGGDTHTLAGHFGTGMFATLLATPCSAPFLGTAVGFALSRGLFEIVAIFLALGLGMALPYLAVAAWPQLAQALPRPGKWMVMLRRLLGTVLLLTGAWLLVVLAAEAGERASLTVGALMGGLLLAMSASRVIGPKARLALVTLFSLAALMVALTALPRAATSVPDHLKSLWQPFDRDAIAKDVADGKVVFVDVTADWCITCQVNKATVTYRSPVADRLAQPGVVAMEADWTRPDETIAAYLASFGRYGIPFNAVYGPGAPDGIPLPELLTADTVLAALDKARKP